MKMVHKFTQIYTRTLPTSSTSVSAVKVPVSLFPLLSLLFFKRLKDPFHFYFGTVMCYVLHILVITLVSVASTEVSFFIYFHLLMKLKFLLLLGDVKKKA